MDEVNMCSEGSLPTIQGSEIPDSGNEETIAETPALNERFSSKRPFSETQAETEAAAHAQMPPESQQNLSGITGNKRRSWLWDHFTKLIKNGEKRAECSYCKIDVCGDSKSGTTVMKNHLLRCKEYPANIDKAQRLLSLQSEQVDRSDGVYQSSMDDKKGKLEFWKFKQEYSRKAFAKMIIMDEMPFKFAEHEGFRLFMSVSQPNFIIPSRFTVARDCYQLFLDERKKLRNFFNKCSSRISLTTDTWTSCQNLCYMSLTAHFIDDNWTLHKKVLNFCPISGHSGEVIGKAVEKCILEWGITRVLTITVDNASANDVGVQYLRKRLMRWKDGTILGGQFVHMRCATHILNLTVREGLKECDTAILRIRNAVRFVKSSPARMQKFKKCANQEQIESKRQVVLDVETRWNSTYLMLEFASIFRRDFDLLESSDGGKFRNELSKSGGIPTDDDWDRISAFLPFLKMFYDATLRLSGSLYVTTNVYLEELVTVNRMITTKCKSRDTGECLMACGMKKKHDKYWENTDNINLLLYVAAVLDPRKKMQFVEWALHDQYDFEKSTELLDKIKDTFTGLYEHYASQHSLFVSNPAELVDLTQDVENIDDWHQRAQAEFERHAGAKKGLEKRNDLTKYLDADREANIISKHFDVLEWWKRKQDDYPIVTLIARDVLAIPVTTVASESAFSTGGRVLDPFRSSLSPRMVEALVCAQDWLRKGRGALLVEESLEDLERIEEELSPHVDQPSMSVVDDYV